MSEREAETLAAFVHGAVFLGNLLGCAHNAMRRRWGWAAIHALGAAVHIKATIEHVNDAL